jgi:tetratricopeptide (TPR) repeat protein
MGNYVKDSFKENIIQEIETFIQSGNLEKAQKHCWYILQNFPKYIQCYRLLGKALMEKSSYEDATFVFNKVLDVFLLISSLISV